MIEDFSLLEKGHCVGYMVTSVSKDWVAVLVCITLEDEGTTILKNPENHLLATQCHITEGLNLGI